MMKEKIYEIPLWDAYRLENCECPLCAIEKNMEDQFIELLFTEMVMDVNLNPMLVEDYRFCRDHFEKLYRYPDKCGLAILSDRILYLEQKTLQKARERGREKPKKGLLDRFAPFLHKHHGGECLLCTKQQKDMHNYIDTLLHLWAKEEEFRKLYSASRGFCTRHLQDVLDTAEEKLKNQAQLADFLDTTVKLQQQNLERMHEELKWFITKFDYRFKDEPWNTSRDALVRTIQKLIGNYNNKI